MPVNTAIPGPRMGVDGSWIDPRVDNYGSLVVTKHGPHYMEMTRRGYSFTYSQAAAGVNLFPVAINSTITTGAFVAGRRYKILVVGDTDFTLIGAAANTIGVEFVATGVGGGTTGQATLMNSTLMVWNQSNSSAYFIPSKVTIGFIGAVSVVLGQIGMYLLTAPGDSSGVITVPTADLGTPVNNQIGGGKASNMVFSPAAQVLTTAPALFRTLGWTALANDLAGKNMQVFEADLQGSVVLKPNNALFIAPTTSMAALAIVSLTGFEMPIVPGAL